MRTEKSAKRKYHKVEKVTMASFNNQSGDGGLDLGMYNGVNYQGFQRQSEEQRINATNDTSYRQMLNEAHLRQTLLANQSMSNHMALGRHPLYPVLSRGNVYEAGSRNNMNLYEGDLRDEVAAKYGVVMSQFQTRFKDQICESLKHSKSADRLNIYHDRIGYLGMKTFNFEGVSFPKMFEAMYLYILDDIEQKQKGDNNRAGFHFLERIGMETDLSTYYKAHRKSNHGGASSALYVFNESECLSFRRDCMRSGLKTDVDAMDEADNKKAKNHPYQRSFYGHPVQKDHGRIMHS
jgi:hypothetical protein